MELLTPEQYREYTSFLKECKYGHFMQTPMWARVKNNWRHDILVVRDEAGKIVAGTLALTHKIPLFPYTIMYCSRGPVIAEEHYETYYPILMGDIKALAKLRKSYVIKVDPAIKIEDTAYQDMLKKEGYRPLPDHNSLGNTQPKYVFLMDINGKTKDEVFESFTSKTRYNIRLSARKGVLTKLAGLADVEDFTSIMALTGARDGFLTREASYFKRLLTELGEHARLYMAYYEGKPVAGTIAISFGNKTWYLYGASSNEHRNVMPNYALQWEMIQWAIDQKSEIYDFRGVSGDTSPDSPMYGLYRFKKGFNAEFTEFLGEWEYIVSPFGASVAGLGMALRRLVKRMKLSNKQKKGH